MNVRSSGTDITISDRYHMIGIGASAGGLAAFEQFFSHLPAGAESELSFVLVQHLDPTHKSLLADLVQRFTRVKIYTVEDGMEVHPGCAYVIPPNKDLTLARGRLRLIPPAAPRGLRLPIDTFFKSLAQDQHERAIGIILSGTGSDGTLGLKAIKGEGGLVMAQTPASAAYRGMPESAIASGLVDYVLSPDQMPEQLLNYCQHAFGKNPGTGSSRSALPEDSLQTIFAVLRARTRNDFSAYKRNMISRRIQRRMAVNLIEELDTYLVYVQQNPAEVEALFNDLLIGVTSFFRDPEAFEVLKKKAIPLILKSSPSEEAVRIWVPGCSTGEEAYSIGISLREVMDEQKQERKIQIFATDIDLKAIEKARAGIFPENIASDLSPERLNRFFIHEGNTYSVKKPIRDMVVFAEQNAIENPPFSRLDLISCRNLMIYLDPKIQKKFLSIFHYALNEGGFLFLGNSEGIGESHDLFTVVDRKWKLYQSKGQAASRAGRVVLQDSASSLAGSSFQRVEETMKRPKAGWRELVETILLDEYTLPCVLINEEHEILYVHGHTGAFLEPAPGEATANILRMAREGLRFELAALLRKGAAQQEPARRNGLRFRVNGEVRTVNLVVIPILKPEPAKRYYLILFQETPQDENMEADPVGEKVSSNSDQRILELERELKAKEDYLQATVEQLETANEELKSTNEEMQASNEELQSTNEELETAKEELQSVNEELATVNTELEVKLDELSHANNDMRNLLAATGIGTLFLDTRLNIQRFTPAATQIINLIPGDVGRPVSDIVTRLEYDRLAQDAQEVLDTLVFKEVEVHARKGAWYLIRILPYRTTENVVEGAAISFIDISEQKRTQAELQAMAQKVQEAREFAESVIETVREPLVVLNDHLEVISANRSFFQFFQVREEETVGRALSELGKKEWNIPDLLQFLREALPENNATNEYKVAANFEKIGRRVLLLNARRIVREAGKERLILLAFEDATHPA